LNDKLEEATESCKGCRVNAALLELLQDEYLQIAVFCEDCGARSTMVKLLAYRQNELKPSPERKVKRRHKPGRSD
jgi:hypothetical protein